MNTKTYNLISIFILLFTLNIRDVSAQSDTVLYYNFATACAAPPSGWSIQNVDGSCTWRCSDGGITQNNHSSSGCTNAANDWLISPPLPLNNFRNEVLSFNTGTQYSGGGIAIKYSTTYPGTGNPMLYTWTTLSAVFPGASGNISLSGVTGDSVYVAFQYTSTGNATGQAARWTVFDIMIKGTKSVGIVNPSSRNIDSTSAILGAEVKQSGISPIVQRGVIWSLSANPTLVSPGATRIIRSGSLGIFDTMVNNLPAGTLINFRGYAFNSTDTAYTGNASFYTLAKEPAAHVTNFTATANSSRSIVLSWTPSATASGYIILQKTGGNPTAVPADAQKYNRADIIGDAIVADTIFPGTVASDTIRNLLTGTRYYFSIIPFSINNTNVTATTNYYTAPVIPTASDSTTGAPYSTGSDLQIIAGSESNRISSVQNTAAIIAPADGEAVLKLAFRDGGASLNDADDMPTIFTGLTLYAAASNTVASWLDAIQSIALFNDSTGSRIGTVTVNTGNIRITGLNTIAADNNYTTATLRLSLKKTTPLTDNTVFHFQVSDTSVTTQTIYSSSQLRAFYTSSDPLKNRIRVSATKIRLAQQPPAIIEAGTVMPSVVVELTDTFNNLDLDTNLIVTANASGNNLKNAPVSQPAVSGKVAFNSLVFTQALDPDTLLISAGGLAAIKSTRFKVKNSASSDIIATLGFAYTSDIPYQLYTDSTGLTSTSSIPVFGITIRDGGAAGADADSAPTVLTSLKLTLTNYQQIKTLALFDTTNTKLGEVTVSSALAQFPGLNITTADDGSSRLIVAATFKKQVTDKTRIQLKVTEALTKSDTSCSGFAATDAGGALSSSFINENKINVTATRLRFVQQPTTTETEAIVFPAVSVEAIDTNNNIDIDGRILNVTSSKSSFTVSATTQAALNPSTGRAVFSNLVFNDTALQAQLTISDALVSITSDPFNIIQPVWYRSVRTGDWDSLSTWEYSTDMGNTWMASPPEIPYALKHGKITIRSGHTVTMRGTTVASRTIDETTIEASAVLILPVNPDQKATVNDGIGNDLVIYGTLKQINNNISGGIQFAPSATAAVMASGITELAANGYANDWAGNPHFDFQDGSVYFHNTAQTNSLNSGVFFPNAAANTTPVFRIGANLSYPAPTVDPMADLTINGILEINANKTFTLNNDGNAYLRNGIRAAGNLVLSGNGTAYITATGEISGTGAIRINNTASLQVAAAANVSLLSDKIIHTNTNRSLIVAGTLNTYSNRITGTASVAVQGTLITAHADGVKGTLNTTGAIDLGTGSSLVLNNPSVQQAVNAPSQATVGKLVVNNPSGALLSDSLSVYQLLDLASGSLFTGPSGLLNLKATALVAHANASRFINGRTLVELTQHTIVPTGKGPVYAPVTLDPANTDTAAFFVEYFTGIPALLDTAVKSGSLKRIVPGNTWYISQAKGNTPVQLSVAHQTVLNSGENIQDLRMVTWTGNTWTSAGPYQRNATAQSITSDVTTPSGYFAIGIDNTCIAPATPVAATAPVCNGTATTINATATGTIRWYAAATGGSALATGNQFATGRLYLDTSFYVEAAQLSCISARVKVPVSVVQVLAAPQAEKSLISTCKNQVVSLKATSPAGTISWYTNASLVTPVATGNTFSTGSLVTDTVFYAAAQQSGCQSAATAIEVTVKTPPARPYTKDLFICAGNTATIAASSNYGVKWYSTQAGTQPFSVAASVALPAIQRDTVLYVESFDGLCASERIGVHVNALPVPAAPQLQTLGFVCSGEAATLHATGSAPVRWYYSERDSLPAASGASFNTGVMNRSAVFFADAFNGSCASARLSVPVTVVTKPSGFSFSLPTTLLRNDSASIRIDGPAADTYTWNFGPDAVVAVRAGRGPHYTQWHTTGTKTISLTVSNTQGPFACTTTYDTSIVVLAATGINESSLANSSVFTVYPNPASDALTIHLELQQRDKGTLQITDLMGKLLWSDNITGSTYHHTIAVDHFAAGMYTLSAEVNGERVVRKIIITKP